MTGSVWSGSRKFIDMIFVPLSLTIGFIYSTCFPLASVLSPASAFSSPKPNAVGIEGPVMSASRIAVLNPSRFTLHARRLVTRDFPTPPLPLTMPITFFIEEPSAGFSLMS